jgi:hypothetical protein
MRKRNKIPTILGIIILLAGTFAGVFFLQINQVFKIGASPTVTPKDVRISNTSDTSTTISWTTEGKTADFVSYGNTQSVGNIENESQNNEKFINHSVTLSGLKAATNYYYKINSEGTNFDNNGIPWQFTTGPALAANQTSIPVSGLVISASGQPSGRAIVYIMVNGYLLSTLTSDSGSFVLQLGQVRTSDLSAYASVDPAQTDLQISVTAEDGESASAQIFLQSANPVPTLVLGQTQDYRNLQPLNPGQNPNANLNLPANATAESKLNASTISATPSGSVILESLNEGETVTSTQPQFFGKGPGGENITITVHSEAAVSGSVKIPTSGSWSWSPPTNLVPGAHSITISWVDSSGITQTLTRDFIVQAGEAPAFVASPSGTTPTPTPTISPATTAVAISTATPTPIPTFIATPTATARPVPVTGNLTPTLLLSIMGITIIAFSVFVWRFSET